ncbi:MAG: hypothetical protein A2261_00875 [Candidatus Magasanikbacteria bacterium RIFOXYA2_FULL_44_8]|uniref:Fimbrial assembly protein n=1 Tax=Candidatus Magasanikbacteria bacterium RIFOXYA2_FULL_44_8 TaxID=1798696 RepID=A0A1F6NJQ0_9BACT|nr:MAG: hypothetical protein A2261_00875 [Candidatus Magasanikbacteria bacterium RIFOXYA2_FULL_44_8]
MMIIDLNLLPPEHKTKLNRLIQILFAKNILEFIAVSLCLFATMLLWSWMALVQQFNDLSESALLIGRDYTNYNQEVRKVNNICRSINESSADFYPLIPKILEVANSLPDTIHLNSVSINRQDNQFKISGTASTRNELLTYQEQLGQTTWLKTASMPTAQLLQKENINFEYQTTLVGLPKLRALETPRPSRQTRPSDE